MSRRMKGLFDVDFVNGVLRMVSATGLMFVVTYVTVKTFDLSAADARFFALIPKFGIIVVVGLGTYLIISRIFRLEEANPVIRKVHKLLFRQAKPLQ